MKSGFMPLDRNKPTPGLASAQMPFSGCAALGTTQVGQWLGWWSPLEPIEVAPVCQLLYHMV